MNNRRGFFILILVVLLAGAALFLVRRGTLRELQSERSRLEQELADESNRPVATAPAETVDLVRTNDGLSAEEFSELLHLRSEAGKIREEVAKTTNQIARLMAAPPRPAVADAPEGQADVTSSVQALLARGTNLIVARNGLAGDDPAYGKVKRLRVEYNVGGQMHTNETTEGATLEIPAGAWVVRAVYGDFPALDPTTEITDVTSKVADLLAKGATSVRAANQLAGFDPAPNISKVLRVQLVVGGLPQIIEADEGGALDIPVGATVVKAVYGNLRGGSGGGSQ